MKILFYFIISDMHIHILQNIKRKARILNTFFMVYKIYRITINSNKAIVSFHFWENTKISIPSIFIEEEKAKDGQLIRKIRKF